MNQDQNNNNSDNTSSPFNQSAPLSSPTSFNFPSVPADMTASSSNSAPVSGHDDMPTFGPTPTSNVPLPPSPFGSVDQSSAFGTPASSIPSVSAFDQPTVGPTVPVPAGSSDSSSDSSNSGGFNLSSSIPATDNSLAPVSSSVDSSPSEPISPSSAVSADSGSSPFGSSAMQTDTSTPQSASPFGSPVGGIGSTNSNQESSSTSFGSAPTSFSDLNNSVNPVPQPPNPFGSSTPGGSDMTNPMPDVSTPAPNQPTEMPATPSLMDPMSQSSMPMSTSFSTSFTNTGGMSNAGAGFGNPPTKPNPADMGGMGMPSAAPSQSESGPTDLSNLLGSSAFTPQPVSPAVEQPKVPSLVVSESAPSLSNQTPITMEDNSGIPMWIIFAGIGILLLVLAASVYFILGVGKSTNESAAVNQTSLNVSPTIRTATPTPVVQPVATGSSTATASAQSTESSSSAKKTTK